MVDNSLSIGGKVWHILISRQFQNLFKGVLSFVIASVIVCSNVTGTALRTAVYGNLFLPVVALSPAITIGAFFDGAIQMMLGIGVGAACWSFIASVAGGSVFGYGALMFVMLYIFSFARALNPRLFGVTLVASLMTFQGVSYTFSTTGEFDTNNQTQLLHTMAIFAVGVAINWAVNILVFPEFAEVDLKELISTSLTTSAALIDLITKSYLLEVKPEENGRRAAVLALKSTINQMAEKVAEADAEVFFSELNIDDYRTLQTHLRTISQHFSSIDAAMVSGLDTIPNVERYRSSFALPLRDSLTTISNSISVVLTDARDALLGYGHQTAFQRRMSSAHKRRRGSLFSVQSLEAGEEAHPLTEADAIIEMLDRSYTKFEEKQFQVMYDLFELGIEGTSNEPVRPQSWESLLEVNFFLFSLQAIVEETKAIGKFLHKDRKKKLHFRVWHYLPNFLIEGLHLKPKPAAATTRPESPVKPVNEEGVPLQSYTPDELFVTYRKPKPAPPKTFRVRVVDFLKLVQSAPSIYGLKGATAVTVVSIVLFTQKTFFVTWGLSGAVISLLVAISPSLGQTYMSFLVNLTGTCIGALWAFISFTVWRDGSDNVYNPYGLVFFAALLAIPVIYSLQNTTLGKAVGFLTLLSYSGSLCVSYLYRFLGPYGVPYDPPYVRLYKQLAATAMGVTFVVLFAVTIYPNLARRILRDRISQIIGNIDSYYVDLVSLTYLILPRRVKTDDEEGLKSEMMASIAKNQAALPGKFSQLAQLQAFARVEPRLEGRFQSEKYAAIIDCCQMIVDRLVSARTAVGSTQFSAMRAATMEISSARHDLQSSIRLLLYIYSSSMYAKTKLPPVLPNASKARQVLFNRFIGTVSASSPGPQTYESRRTREFIRFYSWALAMRAVAREVDRLGGLLKDLFGELDDHFDPISDSVTESSGNELEEDRSLAVAAHVAIDADIKAKPN
ncbi:hypothetical protein SmJEL517_g05723 [Synchytrium microbalum]|uniref:DUF2421 domain-containing protein n=1 Tax=Synchytrium microbalum TaxID=1806994 RepID=A0A507BYJ4_9FUNG|nr:uncharacterized protein SmJEL517_g05723 [Synchytrium microbalum]TPX30796.1 hypothetical protein SmJEL517_g05723 [Synchytrium microbalum]